MFVTHIISGNDFERAVLSLVLGAYAFSVQCYDTVAEFLQTQHDSQGCIVLEVSELMLAQAGLASKLNALQQRFPLILMADEKISRKLNTALPDVLLPVIRRPVVKNELLNLLQTMRAAQAVPL